MKHAVQALKAIGLPELELHPKTIIIKSPVYNLS